MQIVIVVAGHVPGQAFRRPRHFEQCLADCPAFRLRQVFHLCLNETKLIRLQLWEFGDDFLSAHCKSMGWSGCGVKWSSATVTWRSSVMISRVPIAEG